MLYDISPLVSPTTGVWPGDSELEREVLADTADGNNYTLSTLHGTVHLGAHTDAPNHVRSGEAGIAEVPLHAYIGSCQVMSVDVPQGRGVQPADLPGPIEATRLLVATGTYTDPDEFTTDFAAGSPELIAALVEAGGVLFGIDTPSVDLFHSKALPTHHAALDAGIALLEGVVLDAVPDGHYELIALPLKLDGFDASPVRAVLRD